MPRKGIVLSKRNYVSLQANKFFFKIFLFKQHVYTRILTIYFSKFTVVFSLSRTTFKCIWISKGIATRNLSHVTK
jgi:hypothetical protein